VVRLLALLLGAAVVVVVAAIVGMNFGWVWVFAPLLGWAVYRWLIGSLRALVHDAKHLDADAAAATPVSGDERTLFWCEECGTEVLLLVRGTARAPSHCGQRMHERTELLSS
jgi:hypothetical protein